ncbi:MAG: hypothetical protein ABSF29_08645 [Tepidisphaeraceae bacterium]|jgi:hypothetical protein
MNTNEFTDAINSGIEVRLQRGLEIVAKFKIAKRLDGSWQVPSQFGHGRYTEQMGRDAIRSKTQVAQTNVIKCKVLCNNICAVIQSIYELRMQPQFGLI